MPPIFTRVLTKQQLEYVHLTSLGLDSKQIARRWNVTKSSVDNQLYRIRRKLGATDSANMVLIACHQGLIGPDAMDARFIIEFKEWRDSHPLPTEY